MSFLIIQLPDEPDISISVSPTPVISVNYGVSLESDAAVPPEQPTKRVFTFVDADLNGQNRITFVHNLGEQSIVDYALWAPQYSDRVTPDNTIYAVNQLTLDLSSFRPLIDVWTIMIERN
jgi:hypothetical protein